MNLAAASLVAITLSATSAHHRVAAIDLGTRMELFVDRLLIERSSNVELRLNTPERREVALTADKPWEGPSSAYFTAIQDGGKVRLYYRGYCPEDASGKQVTCMAESENGVLFTRPNLGLFDFGGSRENNIVWTGIESHNFAPFLDSNPAAAPDARYKALGGINSKLYAFASPDGIHWRRLQPQPVLTDGAFDSLNTGLWDETIQRYRLYSRTFLNGVRAIQSSTSGDFLHWTPSQPNRYPPGSPNEHFYTNATRPCPGAPHLLLSFPKRFLPERKKLKNHPEPGVSDAVFLSSRNGTDWDRTFLEAWVRPGLDERNWTQRSNMPATGIVQVAPDEFSMYISEHYQWPDNRLRRITVRRHGFASVHAGAAVGEFTTPLVTLGGSRLQVNYATSAAGSVACEIEDDAGRPLPGYSLADCVPLFGDELDAPLQWKGGSDLTGLRGKPVRLRFVLRDADLYALQSSQ